MLMMPPPMAPPPNGSDKVPGKKPTQLELQQTPIEGESNVSTVQ